jgi:ADP-ribose pyrophosphatase YjhB (NUDIX family)
MSPAAAAPIGQRGRVLLGGRARPPYAGMWDLPVGLVESGETPDEGLEIAFAGLRRLVRRALTGS